MRRLLLSAVALSLVATLAFGFGLYSGIRKNAVFEAVIRTARSFRPAPQVTTVPTTRLDLSDRGLLDSTLLPLHKQEILATDEGGKPLPLLALTPASGREAVVIADQGSLFRLSLDGCPGADCVRQIGRLIRPDGTALNDIYDMLRVEAAGGDEWYVSYGQQDAAGFNKSLAISRFTLPAADAANRPLRIEPPLFVSRSFSLRNGHAPRSAGGEMVHDPKSGRLIVTIGDYSLNGISNVFSGPLAPSQSPDSDLGKIVAIDPQSGKSEMVSMGHRNPQGLSLSATGELIATEHAPKGGDEVNLIEAGRNYGWPNVSMGTVYGTYSFPQKPLVSGIEHGGYAPPLLAFLPSPGIGAVIHVADFHPAWDGDLMIATLKARTLMRVRRWPGGSYTEQLYIGERIRDLAVIGGAMVLVTDSGKIVWLLPVEHAELAQTDTGLTTNLNALSHCGACHNLNYPASTTSAPHLRDILGRRIASASDYADYSPALSTLATRSWDVQSLEQFLRAPQDFAPGTTMPDQDLSDADLAELMRLLPLLR